MDSPKKDELRARLRRIAGQVAGVERMVDEDRACADVIMQVNAARAALAKVARLLLQDQVHTSLAQLAATDGRERRQSMDELKRLLACCDL